MEALTSLTLAPLTQYAVTLVTMLAFLSLQNLLIRRRRLNESPLNEVEQDRGDGSDAYRNTGGGVQLPHSRLNAEPDIAHHSEMDASASTTTVKKDNFVDQVLEIFPEVEIGHIQTLREVFESRIDLVAAHLADHADGEPIETKTQQNRGPAKVSDGELILRSGSSKCPLQWRYDFMSPSSFEPTTAYVKEATLQLLHDFPFLRQEGALALLLKYENHYAICHANILNALKGGAETASVEEKPTEEKQYRMLRPALSSRGDLTAEQVTRLKSLADRTSPVVNLGIFKVRTKPPLLVKQPRWRPLPDLSDLILMEEVLYVRLKLESWMQDIEARIDREANKRLSLKNGTSFECSCCCDQHAIQDMISCRDGHLFCVDCLKSFVEGLVFGHGNLGMDLQTKQPGLEITCFHSDGCNQGFPRTSLVKSLPAKLLEKHDELQLRVNIDRVGLEDLCACPKCGFQAILHRSQTVFTCPVENCRFRSCRECGEPDHSPLVCRRVEKLNEMGRIAVEEAATAAKVRACPKCGKAFLKSSGCNQVRCACGVYVCYICREQIEGNHSHFCNAPFCSHSKCNKCPLFSTTIDEDDERAMRMAAEKTAETFRVQSSNEATFNSRLGGKKGPSIRIDVDGILRRPA